jgi:hypothetical protein
MAGTTKSVLPEDDITRALNRILLLLIIYGILEVLEFSNNVIMSGVGNANANSACY